ncbi:MAG TPA: ester cyclase [Chloroflexota bacterium]|nr:ester cyclase [Chloroflexota bacterium]
MATASELLDQVVSTFNNAQWDEADRLNTDDSVLEEIGTGRRLNRQENTANARAWKAAFPDARGVIENRLVAGNQAAGEIVWTGTNTGSLNGMPPTGKPVRVRAVFVLTEEGGKIARARHYLDIAGMMSQLGVAPPPPR